MINYANDTTKRVSDAGSKRHAERTVDFLQRHHDQHELLQGIYQAVQEKSGAGEKIASLEEQFDRFIEEATSQTEFPFDALAGDEAQPFLDRLEAFLDAMQALDFDPKHDLKPMIDQVESTFRNVIPDNPGIAATLTMHYGRRLVGSPQAPADWQREDGESAFSRYRRYADIAHERGWPEMYLLHELLVQHLEGTAGSVDAARINQLIGEIDTLNEADSSGFWSLISGYARNDLTTIATPESDRIAQRTIAFLSAQKTANTRFAAILREVQGSQARL